MPMTHVSPAATTPTPISTNAQPQTQVQAHAQPQTFAANKPKKPKASAKTKAVDIERAADQPINPANLKPLDVAQLRRYSDPTSLANDSHHALPPVLEFGQQRAVKAILTALDIHANG